MKKFALALLAFVCAESAFAQDLRLPATPAFSILGYEPASVMRPTSVKKLSSDILGSFDEDGKLLMNLGLEVTPYWLKNNINLTREEYLNPGFWQTVQQTFSVSAATVRDSITNTNNLGVGIRFELVKGRLSPEFKTADELMNQMETYMATVRAIGEVNSGQPGTPENNASAIAAIRNIFDTQFKGQNQALKNEILSVAENLKATDYASVSEFCKKVAESCEQRSREMAESVIKLEKDRVGFGLEVAMAGKFATSKTDQALQKGGFWINGHYNASAKNNWNATIRLLTNSADTLRVNTDAGLSFVREEKDFNVSVEAMIRWYRAEIPDFNLAGDAITRVEKDFTYRIAAQASYTLTETISANLTIGKDFDDPALNVTGLFSIIGLNYSIFNREAINKLSNP